MLYFKTNAQCLFKQKSEISESHLFNFPDFYRSLGITALEERENLSQHPQSSGGPFINEIFLTETRT